MSKLKHIIAVILGLVIIMWCLISISDSMEEFRKQCKAKHGEVLELESGRVCVREGSLLMKK